SAGRASPCRRERSWFAPARRSIQMPALRRRRSNRVSVSWFSPQWKMVAQGPAMHMPGPAGLGSSQETRDQRHQEQHYEDDEQDLRDFRRAGRDAGKAFSIED